MNPRSGEAFVFSRLGLRFDGRLSGLGGRFGCETGGLAGFEFGFVAGKGAVDSLLADLGFRGTQWNRTSTRNARRLSRC
jgi:hypothetical protein